MKIKTGMIKKMRTEKSWSQEQLSEISGLSLRTIQRIESGNNASMESIKILATAFGVEPNVLIQSDRTEPMTPVEAVRSGLFEYANFSGKATRPEYWWFFLCTFIVMAIANVIHDKIGTIVSLILLVPLLAAGTRRLNDAGYSPWLQFFWIVPFGQIVIMIYLAQPSVAGNEGKGV